VNDHRHDAVHLCWLQGGLAGVRQTAAVVNSAALPEEPGTQVGGVQSAVQQLPQDCQVAIMIMLMSDMSHRTNVLSSASIPQTACDGHAPSLAVLPSSLLIIAVRRESPAADVVAHARGPGLCKSSKAT
jgi:hypothetical protein